MMTLYEKIINLYPELATYDFANGAITLQNDGDGDYIKSWTHPDYPQPTDAQLAGIK